MAEPIRVLLTNPTQDGHDRGVRYVARRFLDAGFEVIFTNYLLPAEIVKTVIEEDVNVVGVSSSTGAHMPAFETLFAGLAENGLDDVLVIGGGVIPIEDHDTLREMGVKSIFGPGATAESAIELIEEHFGQSEESAA
ncbi:MAG: cobalamin-dependent protein [Alphaproteobacteria bacterium]|nr:cobalamin-dependent protein [Alphaproteobacteria bacterium]